MFLTHTSAPLIKFILVSYQASVKQPLCECFAASLMWCWLDLFGPLFRPLRLKPARFISSRLAEPRINNPKPAPLWPEHWRILVFPDSCEVQTPYPTRIGSPSWLLGANGECQLLFDETAPFRSSSFVLFSTFHFAHKHTHTYMTDKVAQCSTAGSHGWWFQPVVEAAKPNDRRYHVGFMVSKDQKKTKTWRWIHNRNITGLMGSSSTQLHLLLLDDASRKCILYLRGAWARSSVCEQRTISANERLGSDSTDAILLLFIS